MILLAMYRERQFSREEQQHRTLAMSAGDRSEPIASRY